MTNRELRRLSRADLLELLVEQIRENRRLQDQLTEAQGQLAEARKKLADRRICVEKAGSIAEAALQLNQVWEAAQRAADQYLENVCRLSKEQER